MRQCMVMFGNKMQKGFFHAFGCAAGIIPPSLMRGGHPGGQVITTYALIELEDGTIYKADPDKVVFLDTAALMSEYDWGEETPKEVKQHG